LEAWSSFSTMHNDGSSSTSTIDVPGTSLLAFSPDTGTRLAESGLPVVVTGGGGWLGQATLEMLESSLGIHMASRVHVFASSRRSMTLRSGTEMEVFPLNALSQLRIGPHLLAHYAFATREFVAQLGTAKFIARNQGITNVVADHVDRSGPVGMLILSSGAVYLGSDMATNPYGVLKAQDEHLFLGMAEGLGGVRPTPRVVIPRLFNLSGPFLNKVDHYVLGSIIQDIKRGGPIRLHADKLVVRSYIHVADLVDLAFAIMLGDQAAPLEAFDTAGEREIEVGELAELAASVLGVSGMPILRPPVDDSQIDRYVGDSAVLNSLARSHGIITRKLPSQIEDTARSMGS
jgi:UDP-glucuronate decarboxylase